MGGLHLAFDNGGTKSAAILFDDDFHLISFAKSGSMRSNTTSAELAAAHFNELMSRLGLEEGASIAEVSGSYEKSLEDRLQKRFHVENFSRSGELVLGLSAAELFGDALMALSGTGASMYGRIGSKNISSGGYGSMVADEGSGYWISREAMIAAIRDFEGRGPRTALTDKIAYHFGGHVREELRAAIFSIYADNSSPVSRVAELVPDVVDTAAEGDNVAISILTRAGDIIADQMIYLIRDNTVPESVPLTVSGSVWRKNPLFFNAFIAKIREYSPARPVIIPRYEPIAGAVIERMNAKSGGGDIAPEYRETLEKEYGAFRFEI